MKVRVIRKPNVQYRNILDTEWIKVEFNTTIDALNYYRELQRIGIRCSLDYGQVAVEEASQ